MRTPVKIVISDSSVLMDLAKTELIEPVLALPFEFMIPDMMLARELLDLGRYKPDQLCGSVSRSGVSTARNRRGRSPIFGDIDCS